MSGGFDMGSEQLCYVHCNYCNTVLAVSVPCSSLFKVVTVRCGNCTNLLSVNMATLLQSLPQQSAQQNQNISAYEQNRDSASSSITTCNEGGMMSYSESEESRTSSYRQPEKKQRVPSAYNRFIKDEIQRIKTATPDISHRDAFSRAAKNWAHFPTIHYGSMMDNRKQSKVSEEDVLNAEAICK
ncbi:axial regulator YABBY 5 isoform X1 [Cryptomeria japonica]|uniref:axial regulator YABBY 5 isoform X1 n=1 Tax=Cryptomeria japonica TaxID=3369 RepID=UPI0027DAABCF|nr:axial regulator YABBY 5 isoform X1 [Cryptomeria japonica]